MDRHAKKLEKKRKQREQAKKQARSLEARKPSEKERLIRMAAREPFGECWISTGVLDGVQTGLISVIVTRQLPDGQLLPGVVLLDPVLLGAKTAFAASPLTPPAFAKYIAAMSESVGGMRRCEPSEAQSVVFAAIDRARRNGFEPDPDFPAALFGPRPEPLTPLGPGDENPDEATQPAD